MISEVKVSKAECQTLQAEKDALVISAGNTEKNAQTTLSEFGKLQQNIRVWKQRAMSLGYQLNNWIRKRADWKVK